jgi:hypothetical protein
MTSLPTNARPGLAPSSERAALLRWTARVGAVSADALAQLQDLSLATARARLGWLARARLLSRSRLLIDEPALYTVTRAGLREAGLPVLEPPRVSAANATHTLACTRAAAVLQRGYPDHLVTGERELRRRERLAGAVLASARLARGGLGVCSVGTSGLHRPDLVLWPNVADRLPVAIEIELTVKAPARLAEICRAWGRSREIAGVVYVAPEPVRRALQRAIACADAQRVVVLPLESLTALSGAGVSIAGAVSSAP